LSGVLCLGWLKKRVAKQLCLGMLGDNLGHLESSFIYPDGVVHFLDLTQPVLLSLPLS
jgi:hypothetical protein